MFPAPNLQQLKTSGAQSRLLLLSILGYLWFSPLLPPHPVLQHIMLTTFRIYSASDHFSPTLPRYIFFFKLINLFMYLFLAVLGLRFCARAFSSCSKQGPLFIAVRGPLTVVASLVAEHRLQTLRLSSCGSRTQLLRGMWDLPRPGLEPVSPALAGRFSTTVPPGKPLPRYILSRLLK